jgi:hypothetical protein
MQRDREGFGEYRSIEGQAGGKDVDLVEWHHDPGGEAALHVRMMGGASQVPGVWADVASA